ncbi:MAG: malate:quinone oxidoreductase, partial [Actinobacteria bacterium]|nr:malate:quinone oxidoreductase [Actinomycetota bacterium]
GYGTFPVSGHFLRTDNPELVKQHSAKVYSQAAVGAPPMSVPHLDTRIVDGRPSLLFGPFAGINPKFLKRGSVLDLPLSVRPKNLLPYISVALKNFDLLRYLIKEVTKSKKAKFEVISSADGTMAGLLGASPGASVSVSAMLDVLETLAPEQFAVFHEGPLSESVEGFRANINSKPTVARRLLAASAKVLRLKK